LGNICGSNANSINKYETEKKSIAVPTRLHDIMKHQAYGLTTFARNLLICGKSKAIVAQWISLL
jgi:hypothetical protein